MSAQQKGFRMLYTVATKKARYSYIFRFLFALNFNQRSFDRKNAELVTLIGGAAAAGHLGWPPC